MCMNAKSKSADLRKIIFFQDILAQPTRRGLVFPRIAFLYIYMCVNVKSKGVDLQKTIFFQDILAQPPPQGASILSG